MIWKIIVACGSFAMLTAQISENIVEPELDGPVKNIEDIPVEYDEPEEETGDELAELDCDEDDDETDAAEIGNEVAYDENKDTVLDDNY